MSTRRATDLWMCATAGLPSSAAGWRASSNGTAGQASSGTEANGTDAQGSTGTQARMLEALLKGAGLFMLASLLALPVLAAQENAEVVEPDIAAVPEKGGAEVIDVEPEAGETQVDGAPQAAITADGETRLGCWLKLDGTGSHCPKGETLSYEWKQVAGPGLAIPDAKAERIWLYFAQPGEYRVSLRVKNSAGFSRRVAVKLNVKRSNFAIPENEGRRVLGAGERMILPGEGWMQADGPNVDLRIEEFGMSLRPVRPGTYIFEAPRAGDVPERRGIIVYPGTDKVFGDRRPLADFLTRNPTGVAKKPLVLDASLSRDPDGAEETQNLKARWITLDKHRGVELLPLPGLKAKFTAARPGTYSVALVVSDGRLESEPPEHIFIKIEKPEVVSDTDTEFGWEEPDITRDDPRYRSVRLGLWESTLDRAVQLFPSRCGVALRVDPEFIPPEKLESMPLNLEVQNGPLMHLIDWVARQTKASYRREGDRAFWMTKPIGFLRDEKSESVVEQVDELYKKPGAEDLLDALKPCFQQIIDARPEMYSLGFEKDRQTLQGVLPAAAKARLKQIVAALRAPSGQGLPAPELYSASEVRLRETLATKKVSISTGGRPLRADYVLRQLGESAGIAIGFDARQFDKGLPRVEVNIQNAQLRDAVRTLTDACGFDGCNIEAPGGLWFYRGARPYPSQEMLWEQSYVAGYDVSRLLADVAPLTGEAVVHAVKSRVYPESWSDPGALIFYHAPTRKLLVMHGTPAHRKILEFLQDLHERAEWALGPVEDGRESGNGSRESGTP